MVDGAVNDEIFLTYFRQHRAPKRQPDDVIIMDNLSSHKRAGIREAIEAARATLLFLAPYKHFRESECRNYIRYAGYYYTLT